jgi:hypothetical protein
MIVLVRSRKDLKDAMPSRDRNAAVTSDVA